MSRHYRYRNGRGAQGTAFLEDFTEWLDEYTFKVELEGHNIDDGDIARWLGDMETQFQDHFRGAAPPKLLATQINLSQNRVGDDGVMRLMQFLLRWKVSVEKLKFYKNHVGDSGAKGIAELVEHADMPLHELHLSHNQISENGVGAIFLAMLRGRRYPGHLLAWGHKSERTGLSPLWLRLEYNAIDWIFMENWMVDNELTWTTASSRDGWKSRGQPPMICMHSSYNSSRDPERSAHSSSGLRTKSGEGSKTPHSLEPRADIEDRWAPQPLAYPSQETANRSDDPDMLRNLLEKIQSVAPQASVRQSSCLDGGDAHDGENAGRPTEPPPFYPDEEKAQAYQDQVKRGVELVRDSAQSISDSSVLARWREHLAFSHEPVKEAKRITRLVDALAEHGYFGGSADLKGSSSGWMDSPAMRPAAFEPNGFEDTVSTMDATSAPSLESDMENLLWPDKGKAAGVAGLFLLPPTDEGQETNGDTVRDKALPVASIASRQVSENDGGVLAERVPPGEDVTLKRKKGANKIKPSVPVMLAVDS
eukprot:TRINITY_DN17907_c0_g1_i1.p1 TRINITY_DN17907_c0_g1~~TRINITY_DN17907_c0_g1_i1.p1  ORF type:complete len:534 (+),score=98.42 TRINITY_DN17907_c0_g1_i1:153-1754(+)